MQYSSLYNSEEYGVLSTPQVGFSKNYFFCGGNFMKRIQDSKKVRQDKRAELVAKWNKKILCRKPTNQSIRASKKVIQKRRQDSRNVVEDQDMYIKETIKQEGEMRKYKE